jgi:hypothetical protein
MVRTTYRSAPLKTDGIFDIKALTVLTETPPFSACIRSTIASICEGERRFNYSKVPDNRIKSRGLTEARKWEAATGEVVITKVAMKSTWA